MEGFRLQSARPCRRPQGLEEAAVRCFSYDLPLMDGDQVEFRFMLPRAWRDELAQAASAQAISMADLMRILLRGFLRNRYELEEREILK